MARDSRKRKSSIEEETVLVEQSLSVAGRPLTQINETRSKRSKGNHGSDEGGASIVLFYQYKEPIWTEQEFQRALKLFLSIGHRFSLTGRGRIAPEGVNCTLTAPSAAKVRGFCQALRDEWETSDNDKTNSDKDLFQDTDFKITDGLPQSQKFKSLSIRKTNELVAYGLEGEKAPSIEKFGGEHLTAIDYHEALKDKNTVVIDVRNAYETAIGTIVPPKDGATLLDPKLRNSREWPKWLASEETQNMLNGKKILTFCTGGIRCERATALINQMSAVSTDKNGNTTAITTTKPSESTDDKSKEDAKAFQPKGVYHMRGGIERYLKTYPQGGYWSGKNYLFDKRMEQLPELKDSSKVEDEVATTLNAKCCLCRKPWTTYRRQHKCGQIQCGVPVLVCDACHMSLTTKVTPGVSSNGSNTSQLRCELCRDGYRAPQGNPDLVAMRKRAEKVIGGGSSKQASNSSGEASNDKAAEATKPDRPPMKVVSDRLFLNRLPLTTKKSEIEEWLQTSIRQLHWITDENSNAFYGSCIVRIDVFSKVLLAIKKNSRARGNSSTSSSASAPRVTDKTDENSSEGPVREFLGCFPGTGADDSFDLSRTTKRGNRNNNRHRKCQRRRKQQQQPKIFRVLAKPGEAWPPSDQKDTEYPPLGRIQ